jgi:lipopolysaccharide transport system permease protein
MLTEDKHCALGPAAAAPKGGQDGEGAEASGPVGVDNLPVTVFQRRSGWCWGDLKELWRFRELLFFLTWRDIKVRYKQTVLGAAWVILQPFATMLVFSVFIGRAAGMGSTDTPYPLFVFAGLLPWTFFANAITQASQSVVGNERLVTKIFFPRLIIPMSAVGAGLVDFLVAASMLAAMMLYYFLTGSITLHLAWTVLLAPVVFVGLMIGAVGIGTLLSALTVAYRDFRYVVPFAIQLWMFATASIYLPSEKLALSPTARALMPLNPAYGLIANFRAALLGGPEQIDVYSLTVSFVVSLVLLGVGCLYFQRVERQFADII